MNCLQSPGTPLVVTHNRREIKSSPHSGNDVESGRVQTCPADSAVYIRNLSKKYGSGPPVLANLCMTVRKGTIYGLLGASGCGKTTILSCIVGLTKWDSGEVLVFGEKPGTKESGIPGKRLGYMPQDLALYDQLSIFEMIQFYGRIYNMTDEEVSDRWIFLSKLLNLPSDFKVIADLSGGQKRRASLCLALMQAPDLIVLDEPTVGLDPLLRQSIWKHLYKIVSTLKTTIIITTHYIEEAKLSGTIGFVRRGKLLVEDTPSNLLRKFNCDLLEDVVLNLCRKDEKGVANQGNNANSSSMFEEGTQAQLEFKYNWKREMTSGNFIANHEEAMEGTFRFKGVEVDCDLNENLRRKEEIAKKANESSLSSKMRNHPLYEHYQKIRGLTTVIMLTFIRHPFFISLLLLLPTVHGSLTLATVGTRPKSLKVGVVNRELDNWPNECEMPIHAGNSCDFSALSCKFINQAKEYPIFDMVSFDSEEDAMQQVRLGQSWGFLTIPSNYSQHTVDLIAAKQFAFAESIEGSRIYFHLDFSQYIASFFMVKDIMAAYGGYVRQLAESCKIGGKEAELPLFFREPVYGHDEDDYTEFLMPGVILICILGILSVLTAVIFLADGKLGTLSRARVAGMRTVDVMISHMITQGFVAIVQILCWSLVLHLCFGFNVAGPFWLYLLICLLAGFCGAALGILVGVLCEDEVEAMVCGVFYCPLLLLFGGIFWPLEGMPAFWRFFGKLLPTTLPIVSLRSVIVRGVGLLHPLVWPGVLVLLGWVLILFIGVILAYRRVIK